MIEIRACGESAEALREAAQLSANMEGGHEGCMA